MSTETAVSSVRAGTDWLVGAAQLGHERGILNPHGQLTTTLGLHVATVIDPGHGAPLLRTWCRRAAVALDTAERAGRFDPYRHDPRKLLICYLAMIRNNVHCASLARFTDEVAEVLDGPDGSVPPILGAELAVLAAMGRAVDSSARAMTVSDLPVAPFDLLDTDGDSEPARKVADLVAGATGLGCADVPNDVRDTLRNVIGALTLQAFKDYDLIAGCSLMRTLRYLRVDDGPAAQHAGDYLISQQQEDGRFGYLDNELDRSDRDVQPDLQVYLPLTVSAMWALGEVAIPSFSIVDPVSAATASQGFY